MGIFAKTRRFMLDELSQSSVSHRLDTPQRDLRFRHAAIVPLGLKLLVALCPATLYLNTALPRTRHA